ncbi:MAG: LysR family transcriptional regulator [Burkholderiaceae bacterium]|jgi:DNA-binding transcriptional LysR family regulator
MRRISLTNLETLCWIARLGSFTAAAERLNATQPAISGRVRELEESLEVKLFQRRGRRMELTIQGRELVERAQPLIARIEEVITSLDNPGAITGILRIGVGEMVAVAWFGELMAQLHERMPRVTYQIEVDLTINMRQKLELGQLDLAIMAARLNSDRLVSTPLGSLDMLWVTSPAVRRAMKRAGRELREVLSSHPIWCLARPSHMYPMAVETLKSLGLTQVSINTCNSLQTMVSIVMAGGGISMLPENMVAEALKRRQLVRLSPDMPAQQLDFVIAHDRDQEQPVVRHIAQLAVQASTFVLPSAS